MAIRSRHIIAAILMSVLVAGAAWAVPFGEVVIGSRYSISGIGENRTAVVIRTDDAAQTVLIRYDDNSRTAWVSPDRLLRSVAESWGDDLEETGKWAAAGVLLLCAMNAECRERAGESSTSEPTVNDLFIANNCHESIDIQITYYSAQEEWINTTGYWIYDANSASYPVIEAQRIRVLGNNVFVYGKSESFTWKADESTSEADSYAHPSGVNMFRAYTAIGSNGERRVEFSCG